MATPWTIRVGEDSEIGQQLRKALLSGQPVVLAIGETVLPVDAPQEVSPPVSPDDLGAGGLALLKRRSAAFAGGQPDLGALAREQQVNVHATFDELKGDFWPDADSVDEFIATVRQWRREG